jgi:hypothetical protein
MPVSQHANKSASQQASKPDSKKASNMPTHRSTPQSEGTNDNTLQFKI